MPNYFQDMWDLKKKFDIRINDRDFKEGDIALFAEYDCWKQFYSGRTLKCRIKYVFSEMKELFQLDQNICVLGIAVLNRGHSVRLHSM